MLYHIIIIQNFKKRFSYMLMCHIVIHSLTCFNRQCSLLFICLAKVIMELAPNRTQLSLSSLYFRTLASSYHSSNGISTVAMSPLTASTVISVPIIREILLPAYFNNIMNKYKVIILKRVGLHN